MISVIGRLLGLFVLCLGIGCLCLGVYVGIWECLVGGIITIIDQIKAPTTDSGAVAWAIVKIIFFELPLALGIWLGFLLCAVGATAMFHSNSR